MDATRRPPRGESAEDIWRELALLRDSHLRMEHAGAARARYAVGSVESGSKVPVTARIKRSGQG